MKKKTIVEIVAALFILLFVYTAMSKLNNMDNFRSVLGKSPLIADHADLVSWLLPVVELAVSALLFLPATKMMGLYSALGLMILFTVYIGYMIATTPHLPCSCGGVISKMSWKQHLFFNAFFILLAITAIRAGSSPSEQGLRTRRRAGAYS